VSICFVTSFLVSDRRRRFFERN